MKKLILAGLVALILVPNFSLAAEVQNLRFSQEGRKRIATYDLVREGGEEKAEVIVTISVDGQPQSISAPAVSGDFGKNVEVGYDKRVVWDAANLPKDFDGDVAWEVKAVSVAEAALAQLKSFGIDPASAIVIGSGPNYVVEFMDPDCPYSRKAFDYLDKRNDVTRYIFLSCKVHPEVCQKVSYVLSASDRADAYQKAMSGKLDDLVMPIPSSEGDSLRAEHQRQADTYKVKGYPTLVVNGTRIPGWSRAVIEKALGQK